METLLKTNTCITQAQTHSKNKTQLQKNISSTKKQIRSFFFQYSKLLSGVSVKEYLTKYKQQLKASKISFNERCFQSEMSLVIIKHSENYDIVTLFVSFSHFSFEISVANLLDQSLSQACLQILREGENNKIYQTRIDQKNIAIKSIFYCDIFVGSQKQLANRKEASNIIFKVIFQYCMCKLFSVFQIGPKIINIFGFDLIIYKNTIQFSMQKCQKRHNKNLQSLFSSLNIMHSFGLIHGDIKPKNIMWSPSFNKWVFINFGFSQVLQQKPGEKTLTKNFETFQNISKEMNSLFHSSNSQFVDLYFYDLNGLKVAINGVFDLENVIPHKTTLQQQKTYFNFLQNSWLCYSCNDSNNFQENIFRFRSSCRSIQKSIYGKNKISKKKIKLGKLSMIQGDIRRSWAKYFLTDQVNFLFRFNQRVISFNGAIDDFMLFSLIYKKFDITPNRYCQKQALLTKINNQFEPSNQQCWKNLVELLKNPYITFREVTFVFENVREKIGIKDWVELGGNKTAQLHFKGSQIASVCIEKYGFNLIELNSACSLSDVEKIKTKILSSQFSGLIELHSNEFPYLQFLNSLQNEQNDNQFISHSVTNMQKIMQKYKIKELPICMQLFQSASKIQLSFNNFETICHAFDNFNIHPAMDLLKNSEYQIRKKDFVDQREKYSRYFAAIFGTFRTGNIVEVFMSQKIQKFKKKLQTYDVFKSMIQKFDQTFEKLIPCHQKRQYLLLGSLVYYFIQPQIYIYDWFQKICEQRIDKILNQKIFDENLIITICQYLIKFKTIKSKKARILELFQNVQHKPTPGSAWYHLKMGVFLQLLDSQQLKQYTKTEIKKFMQIECEEQKLQLFDFEQIPVLFQWHIFLNQSLQSKQQTKAQVQILLKYAYHQNGNVRIFPIILETMVIFYNGLQQNLDQQFIELILRLTQFQNKKYLQSQKYVIAENAIKYFLQVSNKLNKYQKFKNAVFSFVQKGIISQQGMFFIKNGNFIIFLEIILRYFFDGILELNSSEVIWIFKIASQLINKSEKTFSIKFYQAISSQNLFLKEKCNALSTLRSKRATQFRSIRNPNFEYNQFNNFLRNIQIKQKEQLRIVLVNKINTKFRAKLSKYFEVNLINVANLFVDDQI